MLSGSRMSHERKAGKWTARRLLREPAKFYYTVNVAPGEGEIERRETRLAFVQVHDWTAYIPPVIIPIGNLNDLFARAG